MEAADQPGGQIRLLARSKRRSELIGIADWLVAQCTRLGVEMRFNCYAEAPDILAENPDVVIIATGGLPNTDILEAGGDLVVSSWDILSGDVKPGARVLVYDDNGQHPGMQAAEMIAQSGASLEIISPERFFAPDMGGLNHVKYAECFAEHGVRITINSRVRTVTRAGNSLIATIGSDYSDRTETREVDQVVVEHATLPLDEIYFDLKDGAINRGEIDYPAFTALRPQAIESNPGASYRLYRVGDAVASRNIHAAIYESLRLCLPL
jgi:NADPH-dependent 2,4-dienoyl-CoA reductase/sulfur reductase-like enzyme